MRVVVVPVLSDNYAYLIIDDSLKQAAAVDPAEAAVVLAAAKREGVSISCVLTTHHHADHAGGNAEILKKIPDCRIYGGRIDNVMACTDPLDHGDVLTIGAIQVQALHTPGHTKGSISYYCTEADQKAVFTGDTLFVGGCGRIFESTAEELYRSLAQVLGVLPEDTEVYVGHEYTVKNLQFAAHVESSNETLKQMLEWAKEQTIQRKFTVPSTLKNEFLINPFLRSGTTEMSSICPNCTPVEIFTRLRKQKDKF